MWLTLVSMFAGPIGAMVNKGITIASASVVAYSRAKGDPLGDVSNVVAMIALAASTAISGFAATQGVQIPIINADQTNGVRVVVAADAKAAGLPKQNAPLPH